MLHDRVKIQHSVLLHTFFDTLCSLRHDTYETIRVQFKKMGIVKNAPTEKSRKCEKDWYKSKCHTCHVTYICAREVS